MARLNCYTCGKLRDGNQHSYCRACMAERQRQRRKRDPEGMKAYELEWWRNNRDKAKKYKKKSTLKSQYGLSVEEYEGMIEKQNGLCAICEQPPPDNLVLYIDHDHTTGTVRELLCVRCNFAVGQLGESIEVAQKLIAYLQRHSARSVVTGGG